MERLFEETMEQIVAAIRSTGYEPYDQLYGKSHIHLQEKLLQKIQAQ